jgi:hypothetical protein
VSHPREVEHEISTQVRRLSERLAVLSAQRLAMPAPPYGSRAAAVHALAQRFVDMTAELEGAAASTLPWVDELSVVDQLTVTHQDFLRALEVNCRPHPTAVSGRLTDLLSEVRRVRAAIG